MKEDVGHFGGPLLVRHWHPISAHATCPSLQNGLGLLERLTARSQSSFAVMNDHLLILSDPGIYWFNRLTRLFFRLLRQLVHAVLDDDESCRGAY